MSDSVIIARCTVEPKNPKLSKACQNVMAVAIESYITRAKTNNLFARCHILLQSIQDGKFIERKAICEITDTE